MKTVWSLMHTVCSRFSSKMCGSCHRRFFLLSEPYCIIQSVCHSVYGPFIFVNPLFKTAQFQWFFHQVIRKWTHFHFGLHPQMLCYNLMTIFDHDRPLFDPNFHQNRWFYEAVSHFDCMDGFNGMSFIV